jgi:hypothetical protein
MILKMLSKKKMILILKRMKINTYMIKSKDSNIKKLGKIVHYQTLMMIVVMSVSVIERIKVVEFNNKILSKVWENRSK